MLNVIFVDYAQPGDKMTLTFNSATKKIVALNVNTYMGQAKDVVTLQVRWARCPTGRTTRSKAC